MLDQVRDDRVLTGLTRDKDVERYFADRLYTAVAKAGGKATEVMGWMQACSRVLSAENKAMIWTTPAGFAVRQAYYKSTSKRVDLAPVKGMNIRLRSTLTDQTTDINGGKQANAIAPNVIHSFDAAHLQKAVLRTVALIPGGHENPACWPSTVHDSFGVLPNYIPQLLRALRETFVEIYSTDHLARLHTEWQDQADAELPAPPERGSLDISEVLQSTYIFS